MQIPLGRFWLCGVALSALTAALSAQHVELKGRVVDEAGAPVPGARISFTPLRIPPRPIPGVRGGYGLAQRLRVAKTRLPKTITDRDGEWRVTLNPIQAALTTAGLTRFLMQVRSKDHAAWQRCLSGDLREVSTFTARLANKPARPPLEFQVRGGEAPYFGCVVIERAFRVARNRAIWIATTQQIERDGSCTFDQEVRIPGEPGAVSPTARAEGYRVTLHIAGLEAAQVTLPPGKSVVELEPSPWGSRPVLAARAAPAKPPIRATYEVGDEEIVLELPNHKIPLLGEIEPIRVTTGSGEVELDAWDPEVPLFLKQEDVATEASTSDEEVETAPAPKGSLQITVTDRRGNPVYGAGVWLENRAVKRAHVETDLFAVTNTKGVAKLEKLPKGTFSVLTKHPDHGIAEVLADVRTSGTKVETKLFAPRNVAVDERPADGQILLDFGEMPVADRATKTSVGMFDGPRVIWRRFDHRPRFVRIEGLTPGPTNFFVQVGDEPARFIGGELTRALDAPAFDPLSIEPTTYTIRAADADGTALNDISISLGDKPGRDGKPRSSSLFAVERVEAGVFRVTAHVHGVLWAQVLSEGHVAGEIGLEAGAAGEIVAKLAKVPPPPEDEKDGDDKDGDDNDRDDAPD